jgi:hypothetical protein
LVAASLLCPLVLGAQTSTPAAPPAKPAAKKSPWTWSASLGVKETYDSNVYLQDAEPLPANVAAAQAAGLTPVTAQKGSFVTTILPSVGVTFQASPAFKAGLSYSPEAAFYHSASSEDYLAHRGAFNLGGQWDKASWELLNTASYIGGNDLGPTFARPGDVPAVGGIPLRDRREAFIFRNGFKMTLPVADFFLRPVASSYIHDFKTRQRANPTPALFVYENYIDRQDISGGLDAGYQVAKKTFVVAGYRHGAQEQYQLLSANSPYDNSYDRILVGVEGTPWSWLKLAVLGGPDLRSFASGNPAGFQRDEMLYWIDAAVTFLPTKNDSITVMNRRYEQPAFSSFSMYEDITYDITWKHKFDDHWAASAGFRLYIGDWQAPVNREDWIYTPSVWVTYTHDKHLSAELGYSYDWVESKVPGTSGREYTRHLVTLGVRYAF